MPPPVKWIEDDDCDQWRCYPETDDSGALLLVTPEGGFEDATWTIWRISTPWAERKAWAESPEAAKVDCLRAWHNEERGLYLRGKRKKAMAMEEYTREAALREDRGEAITLDMLEAHRVAMLAEAQWGRAAQTMKLGEEAGELAAAAARVSLARIGIAPARLVPESRDHVRAAVVDSLESRMLEELADVLLVALSLFKPEHIALALEKKAHKLEQAMKSDARAIR